MKIKKSGIVREVSEHDFPIFEKLGFKEVEEPSFEGAYSKMKKEELEALLTDMGIDISGAKTKKDLLELLE